MVINYGYYTFESYCNFVFCHFPFRVGILFFSTHHLGLTLMRATAFYPYEGLVAATIWTLRCRPWRGISYGLCHYLGVLISIRYSTLFCSISDWKNWFWAEHPFTGQNTQHKRLLDILAYKSNCFFEASYWSKIGNPCISRIKKRLVNAKFKITLSWFI